MSFVSGLLTLHLTWTFLEGHRTRAELEHISLQVCQLQIFLNWEIHKAKVTM